MFLIWDVMILGKLVASTLNFSILAGTIAIIFATFDAVSAQTPPIIQSQDSVTVLMDGKVIPSKSFVHLYDSTPSKISVGHVAAHLPCDSNGETNLKVVGGVAPDVKPLELEKVDQLSVLGQICMYHADLPQKNNTEITDIALLNPTETSIKLPDTSSVVIHVSEFTTGKAKHS